MPLEALGGPLIRTTNLGASGGRTNYKRSLWHDRGAQRTTNKTQARGGAEQAINAASGTNGGPANHEQKLWCERECRTNYKCSLWHERGGGPSEPRTTDLGASGGRLNYKRSLWHERGAQPTASENLEASGGRTKYKRSP